MVAIDTLSGVAVAKTTGCTAIYHKIKDIVDTHTEVCVCARACVCVCLLMITLICYCIGYCGEGTQCHY